MSWPTLLTSFWEYWAQSSCTQAHGFCHTEDTCFLPLVQPQGDKSNKNLPKAWQDLSTPQVLLEKVWFPIHYGVEMSVESSVSSYCGQLLFTCLSGCPETLTPAGRLPTKSFPGWFLRAREQPLVGPPPPRSTSEQEVKALGLPIRAPAWSTHWSQGLAWEASKILMHSVVWSCHTRLWQIIPDACRGKMEL